MPYRLRLLLGIVFCLACGGMVSGQGMPDSTARPRVLAPPSNADTAKVVDTARPRQRVAKDSIKVASDIKGTVTYEAEDSIVFDVQKRMARMYGAAKVTYTDIKLNAEQVQVDWTTGMLDANGTTDTAGKAVGNPVFEQGNDKYAARRMRYNFKTRKGLIREVVTQQGDGYLHGETVKRQSETAFFVKNAEYTTCNLEHPHFYIKSYKMKMVPGKKIISGPFDLHIADVPTPLGFLFGFFPIPKYKSSGIIIPTYGESGDRGFFLRNGGYYFAVSDYFDVRLLGEIYSRGGYGLYPQTSYRKRYKYDGEARFFYNRRVYDTEGRKVLAGEDFWIDWNHTPKSTGLGRFSASVHAGTTRYNARNSFNTNNLFSSQFQSNVAYSTSFPGTPFSLSAAARFTQNVQTRQIDADLPTISLNMARIYPFKKTGVTKSNPLTNINVAYTAQAQNSITNVVTSGGVVSYPGTRFIYPIVKGDSTVNGQSILPLTRATLPTLLQNARSGVRHSIPVATTARIFRFFNLNPSLSYNETWYPSRLKYSYSERDTAVLVERLNQFSRFYDFSAAASVTTQIYGIFFVRRGRLEAIRHRLNPSIGFSARPDFSSPFFGFGQWVRVNQEGKMAYLSPYSSSTAVYGGYGSGKTAAITFSLTNSVEAKLRSKSDTAKATFVKKSLLDNLSLSGNYNLLADSFQLSNINITTNTRVFDRVTVAFSTILDPYAYKQRTIAGTDNARNLVRTKNYALSNGLGLGTFTTANISFGFNFNPAQGKKKTLPRKNLSAAEERELDFINANPNLFVDFSVPWSLAVQYNGQYSRLNSGPKKSQFNQNVQLTGDLTVSPKWKIGASAPYDFQSKRFASTAINITRDLHCWEMRMYVLLSGTRPMYTFDINVKASILQDLKLSKRNSFYDR